MKKLVAAAALIALGAITVPAMASATRYWGGPMGGGDLPAASITYKVNDGKVRHVQVQVRVKCRAQGGGPHPNARLVMGWGQVKKTSGGFKAKRRHMFDGGRARIVGDTEPTRSEGSFRATYLIGSRVGNPRVCHTGSQKWEAQPMSRKAWLRMRDYG